MSRCLVCAAELIELPEGMRCAACAFDIPDERNLIGDYERFDLLGEGSMGAVYLAKHVASDEIVALKLAKPELLRQPGGLALFQQQAKTESALQHASIVHVQGVGTHDGQPFMVMPLMEGGTLAEARNAARYRDPESRLALLLTIARAVQFAHERGVLHCDLKPENILFDGANEPRVSDFGLARHIGILGASELDGAQGGTRGWMSPEQVRGDALTTASDVFALGALLHWLATGLLPFGDDETFEARVLEEPPPPLRAWTPELAWGLQAVAHRALQKEPERRYESAAALVDDLKRLQASRSIVGASVPAGGRVWYWAQRHPGARGAILLLLPCFAALSLLMVAVQRAELRDAVLDMNAYAASGQAAAVLYQLREYADAIERAAADPAVQALTHGPKRVPGPVRVAGQSHEPCSTQTSLEDPAPLVRHVDKFETATVLDADGCSRARISLEPTQPDYVRTSYDWRDYFAGASLDATRPSPATHVRKAYRSSVSQLIKFAVSAPLFEGGTWVGVVAGSKIAAATLELPRMRRAETSQQMTVLIGAFEGERGVKREGAGPEFALLVHPQLQRGQKVVIDAFTAAQLERAFRPAAPTTSQFELGAALPLERPDYVDALLGGRWLAAFAPVGATGYVVLVQTRDSAAIRPSNGLFGLGRVLAACSAALLLTWTYFFVWRWRRERMARGGGCSG